LSFNTAQRGSAKKQNVEAFTMLSLHPEFTWSKSPAAAHALMRDRADHKKVRLRSPQQTATCRDEWVTAMRISPILLSWPHPQFKATSAGRRICRRMLFSLHEA